MFMPACMLIGAKAESMMQTENSVNTKQQQRGRFFQTQLRCFPTGRLKGKRIAMLEPKRKHAGLAQGSPHWPVALNSASTTLRLDWPVALKSASTTLGFTPVKSASCKVPPGDWTT